MNLLGNIIWLIFGGFEAAIAWLLAGVVLCLTVIGIPFGLQCFKIAEFVLWPFGTTVRKTGRGPFSLLANILWLIFLGWELALVHALLGIIFSLTIIGIPFGKQHFKFASLAIFPFGKSL